MGMPDHITCLLRNLYAGQEATVLTDCGTIDWFKIEKGVHHDCVQSPHRPEEFIPLTFKKPIWGLPKSKLKSVAV